MLQATGSVAIHTKCVTISKTAIETLGLMEINCKCLVAEGSACSLNWKLKIVA